MVAVLAESMVGGTKLHRKVIQREISRVLVLNLSGGKSGVAHRSEEVCLDNVFALIEGHPPSSLQALWFNPVFDPDHELQSRPGFVHGANFYIDQSGFQADSADFILI